MMCQDTMCRCILFVVITTNNLARVQRFKVNERKKFHPFFFIVITSSYTLKQRTSGYLHALTQFLCDVGDNIDKFFFYTHIRTCNTRDDSRAFVCDLGGEKSRKESGHFYARKQDSNIVNNKFSHYTFNRQLDRTSLFLQSNILFLTNIC